jgi:hypothetical protein
MHYYLHFCPPSANCVTTRTPNAKEEKTPESMSLIFRHTRFIISSGVYERPFCTAALCATMRHTHVEAVHVKGY